MQQLIETKVPIRYPSSDADMQQCAAAMDAEREAQILSKLPVAQQLNEKRLEVARLESELRLKEQAELSKVGRLEALVRRHTLLTSEIDGGSSLHAQAQEASNGNTLDLCFSGRHPNPGFAGFWGALEIAKIEIAAKHLCDKYPKWLESRQAALTALEAEITPLARELKLEGKMPFAITKGPTK